MDSQSPTGIAPVIQVHPSRRCNLACAHCYSMSGPTAREDLPLEVLSTCLEDGFALGYRQLAVSGGEPLMYKPLRELLACGRKLGMLTSLTSNGMLITRERWDALAPLLDVVAISIDGTAEEHDRMRCHAGAFARTMENLDVVRSSGVPFGFIFTLTQHNVDSLEFVVRLAHEHGAKSVQVHPLTLQGRAALMLPEARPDGVELVTAIFEASQLGDELNVRVHVDAITMRQLLEYREHLVPKCPVRELVEIAPILVVEADGTVMPLTHELNRTLRLGSLRDARLRTLSESWLAAGRGDVLASACARTWDELVRNPAHAVYWYEEVGRRTEGQAGDDIDSRTTIWSERLSQHSTIPTSGKARDVGHPQIASLPRLSAQVVN